MHRCPKCGCDGTPPLWDRFVRFLAGEIDRVTTPEAPDVGALTLTFARFEDTMAKNAIYRVGISPTTDPNNVGYLLALGVDGNPRDPFGVVDGAEVAVPAGSLVTAALIPVGRSGPAFDKASDVLQFTAESDVPPPPPPDELAKAPQPTFQFLRLEDSVVPPPPPPPDPTPDSTPTPEPAPEAPPTPPPPAPPA